MKPKLWDYIRHRRTGLLGRIQGIGSVFVEVGLRGYYETTWLHARYDLWEWDVVPYAP